jgi:hypothetical protein
VEAFLDSLPTMFQDNVNLESAFGPALKAAFMVMVLFIIITFYGDFFLIINSFASFPPSPISSELDTNCY